MQKTILEGILKTKISRSVLQQRSQTSHYMVCREASRRKKAPIKHFPAKSSSKDIDIRVPLFNTHNKDFEE
jgi:hypothetical protein